MFTCKSLRQEWKCALHLIMWSLKTFLDILQDYSIALHVHLLQTQTDCCKANTLPIPQCRVINNLSHHLPHLKIKGKCTVNVTLKNLSFIYA